jgi:hypothetical protein
MGDFVVCAKVGNAETTAGLPVKGAGDVPEDDPNTAADENGAAMAEPERALEKPVDMSWVGASESAALVACHNGDGASGLVTGQLKGDNVLMPLTALLTIAGPAEELLDVNEGETGDWLAASDGRDGCAKPVVDAKGSTTWGFATLDAALSFSVPEGAHAIALGCAC